MGKQADKYFVTDPWKIIEQGFDPQYSRVAESIFSIANESMGVRGYFEEGYSGDSLEGSYFNGIYEREHLGNGGYKGVVNDTEFMVNAVNWLKLEISLNGKRLDLGTAEYENFTRTLDMKTGLLTRELVWKLPENQALKLRFERLVSMTRPEYGAQRISVTSINATGELELAMDTGFQEIHEVYHKNYWSCEDMKCAGNWHQIQGCTVNTKQKLRSTSYFTAPVKGNTTFVPEQKQIRTEFILRLTPGTEQTVSRIVRNEKRGMAENLPEQEIDFETLLKENRIWWKQVWETSDITICGDEEDQQGIRFCIFQMFQTYHGAVEGDNIGAKGLTGEAYNGNAFWDTETYGLPFFLMNAPKAARSLLMFRYRTLEEAKVRARELDCAGAFYPIATISGKECCNLWQHASLQLQASTAVAYGIWAYEKLIPDQEFLMSYGLEMLVEISRMLATRGSWSPDGSAYGYYCVMGPDEFQMMVNHNFYTNTMGRFVFTYTAEVIKQLRESDPAACEEKLAALQVTEAELEDWKQKAEHMLLLYDDQTKLFEQHAGYFMLPHVEISQIGIEEFPLYNHWSYDRIYRNDMIKQPDVLMLMLLFNSAFTQEQLQKNYEFYEPRCIHESSLSPSVHSILAQQLGKKQEAYRFFGFATRMDLDNYNRNTGEGIHTTSISAAWMNIIYGFGGVRTDGDMLECSPEIPEQWQEYSFHVTYHEKVIRVVVGQQQVRFWLQSPGEVRVRIYGQEMTLTQQEHIFEIARVGTCE